MSPDRMQTSRFELKFVIAEDMAVQIRNYVRAFLDLDENGIGKPDLSYPVHSLYLDSDAMTTYWDTINGNRNRFKLRIRFYDDHPEAPVFLEIKRRVNNCITKERGALRRDAVPGVLAGQLPPPTALLSQEPKHTVAIQHFCQLLQEMRAKPKVHVAFLREAYLPPTANHARLTLDRQVRVEPDQTGSLNVTMRHPIVLWGQAVVLELKFADHYPTWFGELVRAFELRHCGAAKYADGVTLMSGHLPLHRSMPQPNPDLQWPLENPYSHAHTVDREETPSNGSIAETMRTGPEARSQARLQ